MEETGLGRRRNVTKSYQWKDHYLMRSSVGGKAFQCYPELGQMGCAFIFLLWSIVRYRLLWNKKGFEDISYFLTEAISKETDSWVLLVNGSNPISWGNKSFIRGDMENITMYLFHICWISFVYNYTHTCTHWHTIWQHFSGSFSLLGNTFC